MQNFERILNLMTDHFILEQPEKNPKVTLSNYCTDLSTSLQTKLHNFIPDIYIQNGEKEAYPQYKFSTMSRSYKKEEEKFIKQKNTIEYENTKLDYINNTLITEHRKNIETEINEIENDIEKKEKSQELYSDLIKSYEVDLYPSTHLNQYLEEEQKKLYQLESEKRSLAFKQPKLEKIIKYCQNDIVRINHTLEYLKNFDEFAPLDQSTIIYYIKSNIEIDNINEYLDYLKRILIILEKKIETFANNQKRNYNKISALENKIIQCNDKIKYYITKRKTYKKIVTNLDSQTQIENNYQQAKLEKTSILKDISKDIIRLKRRLFFLDSELKSYDDLEQEKTNSIKQNTLTININERELNNFNPDKKLTDLKNELDYFYNNSQLPLLKSLYKKDPFLNQTFFLFRNPHPLNSNSYFEKFTQESIKKLFNGNNLPSYTALYSNDFIKKILDINKRVTDIIKNNFIISAHLLKHNTNSIFLYNLENLNLELQNIFIFNTNSANTIRQSLVKNGVKSYDDPYGYLAEIDYLALISRDQYLANQKNFKIFTAPAKNDIHLATDYLFCPTKNFDNKHNNQLDIFLPLQVTTQYQFTQNNELSASFLKKMAETWKKGVPLIHVGFQTNQNENHLSQNKIHTELTKIFFKPDHSVTKNHLIKSMKKQLELIEDTISPQNNFKLHSFGLTQNQKQILRNNILQIITLLE